jgi:hypothetical protein
MRRHPTLQFSACLASILRGIRRLMANFYAVIPPRTWPPVLAAVVNEGTAKAEYLIRRTAADRIFGKESFPFKDFSKTNIFTRNFFLNDVSSLFLSTER